MTTLPITLKSATEYPLPIGSQTHETISKPPAHLAVRGSTRWATPIRCGVAEGRRRPSGGPRPEDERRTT